MAASSSKPDQPEHTAAAGAAPPFWVSKPAARRVLIGLHLAALLAVLVEWLVPLASDGYALERVQALDFTGSYAVYGFVSCVILVLLGLVLRRVVMRPESFYREDDK